MKKKINVNDSHTKNELCSLYRISNTDGKKMLENVFGKEYFQSDIMKRVKTYEDACDVLDISPILNCPNLCICEKHKPTKDLGEHFSYRQSINVSTIAYLKLCVITKALNDGWEPQFKKGEYRYYPYFCFYTKEQYDEISKDERDDLISINNGAAAGLAYVFSDHVPSSAYPSVGSRLCFKTEELAKYAEKQFIELYYDFYRK